MPDYDLVLRFTAADDEQAERLALAWAGTCRAEYGTRKELLLPTDREWATDLWRELDRDQTERGN